MLAPFLADAAGEDDRIDAAEGDDHPAEMPADFFDEHIQSKLRVLVAAGRCRFQIANVTALAAQPQQSAVTGQMRQALHPATFRFAR